jgi:hypothetical protein
VATCAPVLVPGPRHVCLRGLRGTLFFLGPPACGSSACAISSSAFAGACARPSRPSAASKEWPRWAAREVERTCRSFTDSVREILSTSWERVN